jgi:hypothetical protein
MDSRQRKTGGVLWLNGPRCSLEELLSTLPHGNPNLYHASATSEAIVKSTFVVLSLVLVTGPVFAATINVPADQPTIQAGINAAANGDTVLVAPGTYFENINFMGKAITVKSSGGSKVTIIDGAKNASVVTFMSGEAESSVLSGFTIQDGVAPFGSQGGGINIINSSPSIEDNVITRNTACNGGGGIGLIEGAPSILRNTISHNTQTFPCAGGGGGGGININGGTGAKILANRIIDNTFAPGSGIAMDGGGTPLIQNNVIANNDSGINGPGGAIYIVNQSNPIIVQNLIYGNHAGSGGGIYFLVPLGTTGPSIVSNTIVNNGGVEGGSAIYASGFDEASQIINNLLISNSGLNAVDCDGSYENSAPIFANNDSYSTQGTAIEGTCASDLGQNNNISSDPLFVNSPKHMYELNATSPAIDAGDNSAPDLPKKDFAGKPRIVDGNGDGKAIIDMGAYEFQPQ